MRVGVVFLAALALHFRVDAAGWQDSGRDHAESLRASLLGTPLGRELTIRFRDGGILEATLAEVGDESFKVWAALDEEARKKLPPGASRIKREIRYEEVESVLGAADVPRLSERLAYRVRLGDTVYVRTADGSRIEGKVDAFDGEVLRVDERTMSLSGSEGEKVDRIELRVDDSLKNGALIGAGIGASLVVLACVTEEGCETGAAIAVGAFYAGAGAGLGALFDALKHERQLIYVAPVSSGPRVGFAPFLGRDRMAFNIVVSF